MRHGVDALLNVALLVFFVLYAVNKGFRDERSRQRARFALPILVGFILLRFATAEWWR
jgi:hypothetical protein